MDLAYQRDWYWDSIRLCHISRTGNWIVVDCRVSVELVLRQLWNVLYQ